MADIPPQACPIYKVTNRHCNTQNIQALGFVVTEENICFMGFFSYCKSMGANDPKVGDICYPRGMTGRVYVGYH